MNSLQALSHNRITAGLRRSHFSARSSNAGTDRDRVRPPEQVVSFVIRRNHRGTNPHMLARKPYPHLLIGPDYAGI